MYVEVTCPYCAQPFEISVEASRDGEQRFVSDCEVCCRPIQFTVWTDEEGEVQVEAVAESEG
jgi:transposase-like protein